MLFPDFALWLRLNSIRRSKFFALIMQKSLLYFLIKALYINFRVCANTATNSAVERKHQHLLMLFNLYSYNLVCLLSFEENVSWLPLNLSIGSLILQLKINPLMN